MNLKNYYEGLPRRTQPKDEFIKEVARRCNVTEVTVRNWILYDIRPSKEEYVEVLSDVSGIRKEELW